MHWGERRYQYEDGTLTPEGRRHYGVGEARDLRSDESVRISKPRGEGYEKHEHSSWYKNDDSNPFVNSFLGYDDGWSIGVGDAFDNHKQSKSDSFANALRTPLSELGYTKKESFFFDDDPIWEAPVSHLNYERPEAKKKKTAWDRYKEKLEEESIWF